MSSFENKKVIVTGATGGIGSSVVEKFIEMKATVLATGRNVNKLEELKKKFKNLKTLSFDTSKHDEIEKFIDNSSNELGGGVDILISNVTGKEISDPILIKNSLIKQIESRVRWRESVLLMIAKGTNNFIEIGPGKVLSGLIKRINKNVKVSAINTEEDIKLININD